jgi:hypothetical protein
VSLRILATEGRFVTGCITNRLLFANSCYRLAADRCHLQHSATDRQTHGVYGLRNCRWKENSFRFDRKQAYK